MEKKQSCEVALSPVKTRKRKQQSAFYSPETVTPISGSGYKKLTLLCNKSLFMYQVVLFIKMEHCKWDKISREEKDYMKFYCLIAGLVGKL